MSTEGPTNRGDAAAEPAAAHDGDVAATYCATLVDEWVSLGLTDAVVAPGSRSTPMALALVRNPAVRVHVHVDERSASFMALGLAKATRRPVAVLCTSGTAAVELHPAVVEAHQALVPLLVLTADRPAELHGVGAPQTIDQRDLYGTSVRWYCEPGAPSVGGAPWWRAMARDAHDRTGGLRPGPVHLNLAFREPLLGTAGPLPPADDTASQHDSPGAHGAQGDRGQHGAQWGLTDELLGELVAAASGRRGVIVAGERTIESSADLRAVLALSRRLGWPVLADPQSGCRVGDDNVVTAYDSILRRPAQKERLRPEFVLRIGGLSSSRALQEWMSGSGAVQLGIDRHGEVPDPARSLTHSLAADPATVCDQLRSVRISPAPISWSAAWRDAQAAARAEIGRVVGSHLAATEPAVAIELTALLPADAALVVSSSMPVRDVEWFAGARDDVRTIANRGANGIDGVVSTAVGVALAGTQTALLIGDVAFCHDANGLIGLAARDVDLVIVVIDNSGGGIFSFLPQHELLAHDEFELLFGTPPGVDLELLASAHGIPVERVSTRTGLSAAVTGAFTRGGTRIVVVTTDRERNLAVHSDLADAVADACEALPPVR